MHHSPALQGEGVVMSPVNLGMLERACWQQQSQDKCLQAPQPSLCWLPSEQLQAKLAASLLSLTTQVSREVPNSIIYCLVAVLSRQSAAQNVPLVLIQPEWSRTPCLLMLSFGLSKGTRLILIAIGLFSKGANQL